MDHRATTSGGSVKIEFSFPLVYSVQRPGSHPLRWQGNVSFAVTLCLQVSCQLGSGEGTSALGVTQQG